MANDADDLDERITSLAAELQRLVAASPVTYATVDLTLPQLRAIMLLHRGAALPVGAIGRSLQMSLGSASALVDRLARLRLVTRRENPQDRRQTLVQISKRGSAILDRLEQQAADDLVQAIARMSPERRTALAVALEDLLRSYRSGSEVQSA
jgi:DNA-binding MarR family transcriptional regulator